MQTQVFVFPSTCLFPPSQCCSFIFPYALFCSGPACLPSPPFSFPSSALSNAALRRHWLTGDAAASVEEMERGKEEKEKLLSTKEVAETLKGKLSSRNGSRHPLLGQEIGIGSLMRSVWRADPGCSTYSYSAFSEDRAQMYSSGSPQPGLNQQNGWLASWVAAQPKLTALLNNSLKKYWLLRNAKVMNVGGKKHKEISWLHVCLYPRRPRISRVNLCHCPKRLWYIPWFMQQILLTTYSDC